MIYVIAAIAMAIRIAIGLVVLGIAVNALVDCLRTSAADFTRADKRSKNFWGLLTAAGTLVSALYLLSAFTFGDTGFGSGLIFELAAAIIAGVYLADVRPAVSQYRNWGKKTPGNSW